MTYSMNKVVGMLYLLPAFAVIGIWYVLLFVGNPTADTPIDAITYFLSDKTNETAWFLWPLVVFPLLCLLLSIAYFSRVPRARVGTLFLFFAGVSLALAAWITTNSGLAGLVSAPLFLAFKEVRRYLTPHSAGTSSGGR